MQNRGLFITFEGGEGVGKSTQIQILAERFRAENKNCILTREPGGTELGEDIRNILKFASYGQKMTSEAEVLLFMAARAQIVKQIIRPALGEGKFVLADRFIDSSVAYQGAARQIGIEPVNFLNQFATNGLIPDWTILLDLSPEKGFQRTKLRSSENLKGIEDRMETMPVSFYETIRSTYLDLAKQNERFFVVDASQSKEKIAEEIWNEFKRRFCNRF